MGNLRNLLQGRGKGVTKNVKAQRQTTEISDVGEVRAKCTSLLSDALSKGAEGRNAPEAGMGLSIEQELFDIHSGVNREYKVSVRRMAYNLKENSELREKVAVGEVRASQLCRMQSFDMATKERQEEFEKLQAHTLKKSTLVENAGIATSSYPCPECSKTNARYHVLAGKRDIGKSETWGSAESTAAGMLITCQDCGHKWHREIA